MITFTAQVECEACTDTIETGPVDAAHDAVPTLLRDAIAAGWTFTTSAHGQIAFCPKHADLLEPYGQIEGTRKVLEQAGIEYQRIREADDLDACPHGIPWIHAHCCPPQNTEQGGSEPDIGQGIRNMQERAQREARGFA